MPFPLPGDVLIRSVAANRFELVDVKSLKFIDGPFDGYAMAVAAARLRKARAIWQLNVDGRGRPLGEPFRLPDQLSPK
jgi:hypothetical protein